MYLYDQGLINILTKHVSLCHMISILIFTDLQSQVTYIHNLLLNLQIYFT